MWINRELFYKIYLYSVVTIGICLLYIGISTGLDLSRPLLLILIAVLAICAQFITTSISNATGGTITYEVGTAISLAAVPTFGIGGGVAIVLAALISLSLIKPGENTKWDLSKMLFNPSMGIISITCAGLILMLMANTWAAVPFIAEYISWIVAAAIHSTINTCLVIGIIRLQHGNKVSARKLLQENLWAMTIDIFVMAVGGKLLSYSLEQYDVLGVIVFFLPILMSTFAFQVYAVKVKKHMENLEAIIEERTSELKAVMKEKDHFLAVLTHDMKSPLTTINLYSNMLMKKPEKLLQRPKIARAIYESQQNLAEIVENILDLEKLQVDGSMPLNLGPVKVWPILEFTIEGLRVQAEKKSIQLISQIEIGNTYIEADKGKLKRIFQNILSNSIKYTPENGEVLITAQIQNGALSISFADTGYGIPSEDLPFIFDRFKRVEGHQNLASGTGLGLAIVKALVEAHDGLILVTSEVNVGTTFMLTFPLSTTVESAPSSDALFNSADPANLAA